jgi:hypothetical protein
MRRSETLMGIGTSKGSREQDDRIVFPRALLKFQPAEFLQIIDALALSKWPRVMTTKENFYSTEC